MPQNTETRLIRWFMPISRIRGAIFSSVEINGTYTGILLFVPGLFCFNNYSLPFNVILQILKWLWVKMLPPYNFLNCMFERVLMFVELVAVSCSFFPIRYIVFILHDGQKK